MGQINRKRVRNLAILSDEDMHRTMFEGFFLFDINPLDNATAEVTIHPSLDPTTLTNASAVISQSNYRFRSHNASSWHGIRTNIGISGTDKVYWEVICGEDDSNNWAIGVGATFRTFI